MGPEIILAQKLGITDVKINLVTSASHTRTKTQGSHASWKSLNFRSPISRPWKYLKLGFWSCLFSEQDAHEMLYIPNPVSPFSRAWLRSAHVFVLSFFGVSACVKEFFLEGCLELHDARQVPLRSPWIFQMRSLRSPRMFGLKKCTNPESDTLLLEVCCECNVACLNRGSGFDEGIHCKNFQLVIMCIYKWCT